MGSNVEMLAHYVTLPVGGAYPAEATNQASGLKSGYSRERASRSSISIDLE